MVVENGRITWIGPDSDLPADGDRRTVNLENKYVIPGLIDLHVHLGHVRNLTNSAEHYSRETVLEDLHAHAVYGVTSVLAMGTDRDLIYLIRSEQDSFGDPDGHPVRARVFTSGQGISYEGGYGGLDGVTLRVSSVSDVEAHVARQAAAGANFIKIWVDDELGEMPKIPLEMTQAAIDAAHRHGLRAVAHVFYLEDAKTLVRQGIDALIHTVRDHPVDQELIDLMRENDVWLSSGTLSREGFVYWHGRNAPFMTDHFFTQAVNADDLAAIQSEDRQRQIASSSHYGYFEDWFEMAVANYGRLAAAGVFHGMGTDAGLPGRFPGYGAHVELELMVQAGLTPLEALTAATGQAARFLDADDIGVLEASRWADFVVLDADPVTDIRNTRSLRTVYVAGREVPPYTPPGGAS